MRITRLLRASHSNGYQPMIKFLGQSQKPTGFHATSPAPHPAAPKDVIESSFLSKLSQQTSSMRPPTDSSSGYGGAHQAPIGQGGGGTQKEQFSAGTSDSTEGPIKSKPVDYEYFWEAPKYLWVQKEVSEREMEAVMSGGATDIRTGP